jgi:hypothetical protein
MIFFSCSGFYFGILANGFEKRLQTIFARRVLGPTNFFRLLSGPVFCLTLTLSDEIGGTLGFFSFFFFKLLE